MIRIILLVVFFSQFFILKAEDSLVINRNHQHWSLIPAQNHGCWVFGYNSENVPRKLYNKFYIAGYDTLMKKKWDKDITLKTRYYFDGYHADDQFLYLVFSRYSSKKITLYRFDISDGSLVEKTFSAVSNFGVTDVFAYKNVLITGGRVRNNPVVYYYNFENDLFKVLPSGLVGAEYIESIHSDEETGLIDIVFAERSRKRNAIVLRSYDIQGDLKHEFTLTSQNGKYLLNAGVAYINEEKSVLTGTYADHRETSSGVFISVFQNGKQESIHFFTFDKLGGFQDILEKEEDYIKRKSEEQNKLKGIAVDYRLNPYNLYIDNNKVYYLAEAYYPEYRIEDESFFSSNGTPVTQYYYVFDHWKFTHYLILEYTTAGELLNSTIIQNIPVELDYVAHLGTIRYQQGEPYALLPAGLNIFSYHLNKGDIKNLFQAGYGKKRFWYDNRFLEWEINNNFTEKSQAGTAVIQYNIIKIGN